MAGLTADGLLMARLAGHGIQAELPRRFEGRIFTRSTSDGAVAHPIAHFATFPLPPNVADFGGNVTPTMSPTDVFAVLFEYGPESLGKALFVYNGIPLSITIDQFFPFLLRRGVGGQSGTQWFFTEGNRPFTFYAVLGSHVLRPQLVPEVNSLLRQITITPNARFG
jgi:hypothetical protein